MASEARLRTFKAAWDIQRMMYGPDFWPPRDGFYYELNNVVERSDSLASLSRPRPNTEPRINPGRLMGTVLSREGLAVFFIRGFPVWMETPWGEWWCWGEYGPGQPNYAWAHHQFEDRFLERIGHEKSSGHEISRYPILNLDGVELPSPTRVGWDHLSKREIRNRMTEWILLCEEMEPPRFPHFQNYIEARLNIPESHPEHQEAIRSASYRPR